MTTLLEKVLAVKINFGCSDRHEALLDIQRSLESIAPYDFAKMFNVLENDSAEEFMIQFMSAFNKEVYRAY